jgi:pathogenesis-related protein 1
MRAGTLLWCFAAACSGTVDNSTPGTDGPGSNPPGDDGSVPPADVPGGVGEPAELQGITLFHNQARAMVQTATPLPSLQWEPALAATAAAWVATCQDTDQPIGLLDHNPNRSDGHPYYVGENIFASSGQASAQQAVDLWVAEKANYDYATNTCNGTCGHYTQVVWRDTLYLGCALGNCPGLQFSSTIVCDYGPGGNIGGQLPY